MDAILNGLWFELSQTPSWLVTLADASLKVTLVLAVCAGAAWLLRGASASVRHLVWTSGVLAALVLPALGAVVPSWHVPLLPALHAKVSAPVEARPVVVVERVAAPVVVAAPPARATVEPMAQAKQAVRVTVVRPTTPLLSAVPIVREPEVAPVIPAPVVASVETPARSWGVFDAFALLWAAGMLLAVAKIVTGQIGVWRLGRRARPVKDARRVLALAESAERLGLTRQVALLETDLTTVPMTWGVRHPKVLLPADSRSWPTQRLERVLLHELAHVQRFDALTQCFAQLACAVYWFNPMVWIAAKRMRELREYACDDQVLNAGSRPSEYAGELLELVRSLGRREHLASATLAMARKSQLEGRLVAILDPALRRDGFGRGRASVVGVALLMLLLPLASLQPTAEAQPVPRAGPLPRLNKGEAEKREGNLPPEATAPTQESAQAVERPVEADDRATDERERLQRERERLAREQERLEREQERLERALNDRERERERDRERLTRESSPAAPIPPVPPSEGSAVPPPPAAVPDPAPYAVPAPPPAPTPYAEYGWSDQDDDGGDDRWNYKDVVRQVKRDEKATREAIAAANRDARSEDELVERLEDIADDSRLAAESTRQDYLRTAARVRDDDDRAKLLKKLLHEAPITAETQREVLRLASELRSEDALLEVLEYTHRIKESDLVRGPNAKDYLDAVERLRSDEPRGEALRMLLHPSPVTPEATARALELASRFRDDDARKKVLIEVSDHQQITREVEEGYRKVMSGLGEDPREFVERLDDAKRDRTRGQGRRHARNFQFQVNVPDFDEEKFEREMERAAQEMERAGREMERAAEEAERNVRNEVLSERARERYREEARRIRQELRERLAEVRQRLRSELRGLDGEELKELEQLERDLQ